MNARKKFLLQGSLASVGMLVAKPFNSFAKNLAPITGYTFAQNSVVLAHICSNCTADAIAVQQVAAMKKNIGNVLLVHAGKETNKRISLLPYDASLHLNNSILNSIGNYKVVYKADVKIGIITAITTDDVIASSNTLASYLKKEKSCHLVVCLSQLGYRNKSGADDLKLAEASQHIDVIVSGHARNFSALPVIARNSKREEVIIHSATDNGFALGSIEIAFAKDQTKRSVNINNLLTRI